MATKVMSLPMGPYLTDNEAREVAEALLSAVGVPLPAGGQSPTDALPAAPLPASP
jgi:hypothetical protein